MKFVKTDSPELAAEHIAHTIAEHLKPDKHLLWLVSGGNSMDVAVSARQKLADVKLLDHLLVMQADERFGPPGHKDSNWQKLLEAGFDTKDIDCRQVLRNGLSFSQTAQNYEKRLATELKRAYLAIGLFGIGADGHMAGVLPGSPAVDSAKLVESYEAPDFMRITITPAAIAKLDLAFVYAVGEEKHDALKNLQKDLSVSEQPAQALKLTKEAYVYNDYVKGDLPAKF